MKVPMRKILISSLFILFASNLYSNDPGSILQTKQKKIQEMEQKIEKNLKDTTVLELFLEEKTAWEKYVKMHIALLFPEEINDVKMAWGSIESHEITLELIRLLDFRIMMLEKYLTRSEGTDGEGRFKEYVNELKIIQQK